jgi:carboxymethylenebutenolidase
VNGKNHVLELTSRDGAHFTAYAAQAKRPGGIGIVILPGGRGLEPIYTDMADHFATAGIHVIAIDHFGRTAGLGT